MTLVVFPKVVQKRIVQTFCRKCKKKRNRVLVRQWYQNGFHDADATWKKYDTELDVEVRKMKKSGIVCNSCET